MTRQWGELPVASASARHAMVEALRAACAVSNPEVLDALGRVPREVFVPRFWSLPTGSPRGGPGQVREWSVHDDPQGSLELVYDIDRALAIRYDPGADGPAAGSGVTSTASAPRIVASMLELLELAPGMNVLEIGVGSGYNAALLRELVGPDGSVSSVDIDADLVAETSEVMRLAGYGDVALVTADGYFGSADRAPFDRVVATVGCVDVAPSWLEQLAPGGFCLVPLQHGAQHPLMRIAPSPGGANGLVLAHAGFVAIRGQQAGASPWPDTARIGPDPLVEWLSLPRELAADLSPEAGREAIGGRRRWDLAYLLALEDRRAGRMLTLVEDGSCATIEPGGARVGWAGPGGAALRDRLLDVAHRWIDLGRPTVRDYKSTFALIAGVETDVGAGTRDVETTAQPSGWVVDRFDFRQTVEMRDRT